MKIKFKRLKADAFLPTRATKGSVGFDLKIPEDVTIKKGRNIIPLNFAIEMPIGYEFKIEPRSGFSARGMEDAYGKRFDADVLVGKIDSDYRGNVGVIVSNRDFPFLLERGTRIAQGSFYCYDPGIVFEEVEELNTSERGEGGFGHTGK